MLNTRISEIFGLDHPILQGGMQPVSTAELVSRIIAEAEAIITGRLVGIAGCVSQPRVTPNLSDSPALAATPGRTMG